MYRNLHIFTYPPLCNEPFLNPPLQTRREFRNSWKRNLKGKFTTTIDPSIAPCKIDFTPIPPKIPPQLSITPKLFQLLKLDNLHNLPDSCKFPLLNQKVLTYMKLGLLCASKSNLIDNLFVKCWKSNSASLLLSLIMERKDEQDFTHFISIPF